MAFSTGKIDFVLPPSGISVPSCDHGPTLLLERYDGITGGKQFFSCSAFRDGKTCVFYRRVEDIKTNYVDRSNPFNNTWHSFTHRQLRKRFKHILTLLPQQRVFCVDCGLLILEDEHQQHNGHTLHIGLSNTDLKSPTKLFPLMEDKKTYAQYMFTDNTVDFVISSLQRLSISHVLCIGCPSIHEYIMNQKKSDSTSMSSLLLDLDQRYMMIYPPKQFLRYNMMNHHFFGGEEDHAIFESFIKAKGDKRVAILVDPPFGILVDAFAVVLSKLQECCIRNKKVQSKVPILWFFPYFMEKRVTEVCKKFTMLDYKVSYDKHCLISRQSTRGSPVRIFTNLESEEIPLSEEEGYWFCQQCDRYSAAENKHCDLCNACTTKDGPTYKHCEDCNRCVKPSRIHCPLCDHCDLPDHVCHRIVQMGCHICGDEDHKKRECPKRQKMKKEEPRGEKRKPNFKIKMKKKKKKIKF